MDEITHKRVLAAAAVIAWMAQAFYVLFPIDLLPDFIPLIGWIDDLAALVGLGATTLWMVRTVNEVGVRQLVGLDAPALPSERVVYEPLPAEVIRSL